MQKVIDGRKAWLDENQVHAGTFLSQMFHVESRRLLSPAEEKFKHLAAAYIYLYEKAQQKGVLDQEDLEYLFENETLH